MTEIRRVRLADLRVDYLHWTNGVADGYQRPLDEGLIQDRLAHYDESLVGIIVVSERPDETLWTVDANHRVEILRRRGVEEWFAEVHHDLSREQEANLYYRLNHDRKMPNVWNQFGSRASAGDPVVLAIIDLAHDCGFKVGSADRSLHSIAAVNTLEKIYLVPDGPRLIRHSLSAIARTWPTDVVTRDGTFIEGVAYFTYTWDSGYSQVEGNAIDWGRFGRVFAKVTGPEIQKTCKQLKIDAGFAMNGVTYAVALRDIYNGRSTFGGRLIGKVHVPRPGGGHKNFGVQSPNRVQARSAA